MNHDMNWNMSAYIEMSNGVNYDYTVQYTVLKYFLLMCSSARHSCCLERGSWSGCMALKRFVMSCHATLFFSCPPSTEVLLFSILSFSMTSLISVTRWLSDSGKMRSLPQPAIVNTKQLLSGKFPMAILLRIYFKIKYSRYMSSLEISYIIYFFPFAIINMPQSLLNIHLLTLYNGSTALDGISCLRISKYEYLFH